MSKIILKPCNICKDKTSNVFNIDFKAVPICEGCAISIFIQQAHWYVKNNDAIIKLIQDKEKK